MIINFRAAKMWATLLLSAEIEVVWLTHWPREIKLEFHMRTLKHILFLSPVFPPEISHRWMSRVLTDDTSTLAQVISWCHKAASY